MRIINKCSGLARVKLSLTKKTIDFYNVEIYRNNTYIMIYIIRILIYYFMRLGLKILLRLLFFCVLSPVWVYCLDTVRGIA